MQTTASEFNTKTKLAERAPARPFFRYPGAKNLLAPWIIGHFPAVHDTYVLPYGGSAATLFKKARSGIEVYNDLNGELVHLFRMIREETVSLIQSIKYTLWSPAELILAQERTDDPIERARRCYVRMWMSRYPFDPSLSFRRQKVFSRGRNGNSSMRAASVSFQDTDHLFAIADRLTGVTHENMRALALIRLYDYDRALFYCDPPYVQSRRVRSMHYAAEMSDGEHIVLAGVLNGIEGMAVVSGYRNPLYETLYEEGGWRRVDRTARVDGAGSKVESLWLSPRTAAALEEESGNDKLPIFGGSKWSE